MQSTSTTTLNTTSMKNTFKFQKETVGLRFEVPHIYNFLIHEEIYKKEDIIVKGV